MKTTKKSTKKIAEFTPFNSLEESRALEFIEENNFTCPEKVLALCLEDNLNTDDLDSITENNNIIEIGNREWLVVTDEEGDELWDECLDSFIDSCIIDEIPKHYRNYFDCEKFKQDCKYDGRAHSLAGYDGRESTQNVNGITYYIYRTN